MFAFPPKNTRRKATRHHGCDDGGDTITRSAEYNLLIDLMLFYNTRHKDGTHPRWTASPLQSIWHVCPPTGMFLESWRKPEDPEETHTDMGRTHKTDGNLSSASNPGIRCTTVHHVLLHTFKFCTKTRKHHKQLEESSKQRKVQPQEAHELL